MSEVPSELSDHYLFAALDKSQRQKLMDNSQVRHLGTEAYLFRQGDSANAFWWLESGQIKLYRLSSNGNQKIMGLVTPHQSFAEGVLFMDTPHYPVNAEAVTPSTVRGFDRVTYLRILETSFATCRALMRQMVQRTQRHLDEIEALTIRNARFRLVHYLLSMADETQADEAITIRLPARKALIASQLAIQPETLSRLFRELERRNMIQVSGDTIRIIDPQALRQMLI